MTHRCARCGTDEPKAFAPSQIAKRGYCRACMRDYARSWHAEHREQTNERLRAGWAINVHRRSYLRAYAKANPDLYRAACRRYHATHKEEIAKAARLRRLANLPAALAREAIARARYREKSREYARERQRTHPEIVRDIQRRSRAKAPWKHAAHQAVRNFRLRGATGTHSPTEWREKCELFAFCCAYCGEHRPLARDHKVPITRGGTNDITNILPVCVSCNSRKGTMTTAEFLAPPRKAA